MATLTAERPKVGRKKKAIPSDYVSAKLPRDVHRLAKLIVALSDTEPKLEIGQVIGDACRDALQKRADELYKASKREKT